MPPWVELMIWKVLGIMGDIMTMIGLLGLLAMFCWLLYHGMETLIDKEDLRNDDDRREEARQP